MAEQILIEFVGDTAALQPAIDLLTKTGQISEKDAAAFKNLGTASNTAFKNVAVNSKTAIKSLGDVEKSAIKLTDTFQDEVAAGITDALEEAGVSVDEFNKALEGTGVFMGQAIKNTDGFSSAEATLKKQLKETNAGLALMKIRGEDNTKQYQELREKAGHLHDAIGDVNEEVARAGSDTRGFDNLLQLASGVTAGFAVAQGSLALFGDQGEEVQKTLLKVNAAMAILQGLQQIQAILAQKNFQSLTALVGIKTIETVQTNLQAAAESKNIVIKYAAIAAQKALNFALALSPLGLVVAGVTAIAAAWALFSSKAGNAIETQKKLNAELDKSLTRYDKNIAAIKNSSDLTVAQLASELANRKNIAAVTQEGIEMQLEQARQAKKQADDVAAIAQKNFGFKKKLNDDEAEQYKASQDKKNQADEKYYSLERELQNHQFEQSKADLEDSIKSHQAFVDAKVLATQKGSIAEIDAQIAAAKASEETIKKQNPDLTKGELTKLTAETNRTIDELLNQRKNKILENEKAVLEIKLASLREGSVQELEQQKLIAAKQTEIDLNQLGISKQKKDAIRAQGAKEQIDFDRKISIHRLNDDQTEINTRLALSKEGSDEQLKAQLDLLQNQRDIEITAAGDNKQKKLLIDAEYFKAVEALLKKSSAEQQTIVINTKQSETNAKIAALQRADVSENNKELLQLNKDAIEEQAQLDIVGAHLSITNAEQLSAKILEIRAKANADKLSLDQAAEKREIEQSRDNANQIIDLEKKKAQNTIDSSGFNFVARQKATNKLYVLDKERIDNEFATNEELHNKLLISEEDYQKTKHNLFVQYEDLNTAKAKKAAEERNAIISAGFQILTDSINASFDIADQRRQADLAKNLSALDAKKQQEVDNKNLTQAQISNIDERYKLKEQQLRLRAFEADKKAKRSQAIITGALGVLNAIATAPTIIAGLILAAGVVATTAIQIAKINSAPPPAFKKGTKKAPPGLKWVGEEGPELIDTPGGERIFTYKQSMAIADSWRGGSLASANDRIAASIATPNNEVLSHISVNSSGSLQLSKNDLYDAFKQAIEEGIEIPAAVQVHNNFDENGLQSFMVSNGNRIQQRNKRHKWG